jgi:hypothetical protein
MEKIVELLERMGISTDTHTICLGGGCNDCSYNMSNASGAVCGGSNCGWCHDPQEIEIEGQIEGQIVGVSPICSSVLDAHN